MKKITENQRAHLVRMGLALDEIRFRSEAERRVIEATRAAAHQQRDRITRLKEQLAEWNLRRAVQAGDEAAVKRERSLRDDLEEAELQFARLDGQLESARGRIGEITAFVSPLRDTFDALLKHLEMSAIDLGIPHGSPTQPHPQQEANIRA